MALKIKTQFSDVVIGFNNSSLPLGQRDDLHILYELAKVNQMQQYLEMFEEQLTDQQLMDVKEAAFNKKQQEKFSKRNNTQK